MNAQHTAGPWETNIELNSGKVHHTVECKGQIIADVYPSKPDNIELLANARLIAAAPELLEALWIARGRILELQGAHDKEYSGKTLGIIDEILSKAEGK